MVNLWPGVWPKYLCDKHLNAVLAEFNNKLLPSMRKGHEIQGYLTHGCIDLPFTLVHIYYCLEEARSRGHNWKYQQPSADDAQLIRQYLSDYSAGVRGTIKDSKDFFGDGRRAEMFAMNKRVLAFRCPDCRKKIFGLEPGAYHLHESNKAKERSGIPDPRCCNYLRAGDCVAVSASQCPKPHYELIVEEACLRIH